MRNDQLPPLPDGFWRQPFPLLCALGFGVFVCMGLYETLLCVLSLL